MILLLGLLANDGLIWVEGEAAKTSAVQRNGWYDSVKKAELSGGSWMSHFGDKEGTADYEFEAASPGERHFWVRANPVAGAALSYRLNGGTWAVVPMAAAREQMNIAENGQPDLRFIAWIPLGKATLVKGKNTLSVRLHSGHRNHGALDCFLFSSTPFLPNGALRPGQKLGLADPGRWAFEPDPDVFDPKAELDLRSLNEKRAGAAGWVKSTPQGGFVTGDGQPLRFWAVNSGLPANASLDDWRRHARFLAKRGVNMVRIALSLAPTAPDSKVTDVNAAEIDKAQKIVAAMRDEGIYTMLVPFWGVAVHAQPGWGIPGKPNGVLAGTLFWDETLQSGYKAWTRAILTRPNPYTNVPLGKDPALAIWQTQNEDSLLFWTIGHVKGEEARRFGEKFGRWLSKKYGTLEKAREAWPGVAAPGDDFPKGVAGFLHIWEMTQPRAGAVAKRLGDQLQFWSETMRDFNVMIQDFVRKELACDVLINAGNWRTADQVKLLDAERWSYAANAVIGSNKYYTGLHVNPNEGHKVGHLVSLGDYFTDSSALTRPRDFAVNHKQVAGSPFVITESTWVPPLGYQSEGPFLVAAYSALTGVDAYYWFALGNEGYDPTINKWQAANPAIMGGFPAASWMFRKGFVREGEPVVKEVRSLDSLWRREAPKICEESPFDPNRDAGSAGKASNIDGGLTPLAFLAGPVVASYGGDPSTTHVADLTKLIDERAKTVKSVTGELLWDYGRGLCSLTTSKAAGATGFLSKEPTLRLGALTLRSSNDYGTLLAVSMDEKDLTTSAKVLLQATTLCRPYGWKESEATFQDGEKKTHQGKRIDSLGSAPWNVAHSRMEIELANPRLRRATALDPNGLPVAELKPELKDGVFKLRLPENALYVLLR